MVHCFVAFAGTYADTIRFDRTSKCENCPNGTTNDMEGGDSKQDCDSECRCWWSADGSWASCSCSCGQIHCES